MPYIKQEHRSKLYTAIEPENPGELNYSISLILKHYINKHGLSYQTINDVVGALENTKMEFYRRIVGPYENKAIERNGDIY